MGRERPLPLGCRARRGAEGFPQSGEEAQRQLEEGKCFRGWWRALRVRRALCGIFSWRLCFERGEILKSGRGKQHQNPDRLKLIQKGDRGQEPLHFSFSTSAADLHRFTCRTTLQSFCLSGFCSVYFLFSLVHSCLRKF